MLKSEFVKFYAKENDLSLAESQRQIENFLNTTTKVFLKGEDICFRKYGTFKVVTQKEIHYTTPVASGVSPEKKKVRFYVSDTLVKQMNSKKSKGKKKKAK